MFEQYEKVQTEAESVIQKQANVTSELASITQKLEQGTSIDVDLDNAMLSDVEATQAHLNENIVTCIMDLDSTTSKFGEDFSAMSQRTGWEKIVGVFSSQTSAEMQTKRVKNANISDNLQNLLTKANQIVTILTDSKKKLESQIEKGNDNLTRTVRLREETVSQHQELEEKVLRLNEQIQEKDDQIINATDATERAKFEGELAELNKQHNELHNEEQVMLAKSQTLENYVQKNEAHLKSLNSLLASQKVQIEKLTEDTQQRVVLYEQYLQTLKVSQEQRVGAGLDEVGSEVDMKVAEGMAQAGHAAANTVMKMLERHNDIMDSNQALKNKSAKATQIFEKRFRDQIQRHNSGNYSS